MIVQKIDEENPNLMKTYSDTLHLIRNEYGEVFEVAIDPADSGRIYFETDEFISTVNSEQKINDVIQEKVKDVLEELKIQIPDANEKLYSKYKLMVFLKNGHMWDKFKFWINSNEEIKDFWDTALEFDENDENFQKFQFVFKKLFNIEDEKFEKIKEFCRK